MPLFVFGMSSAGASSAVDSTAFSPCLVLISRTFLCELECKHGTKVGLAAGRYSGKRRPDLYRTPQALQRVLGPNGPARHCGVFVTSQCKHFLTPCGLNASFWSRRNDNLIFFVFLASGGGEQDSAKFSESDETLLPEFVGDMSCGGRGMKDGGRGRLLRARPRLPAAARVSLSPEQELLLLLLSRTETGLEVWNWFDGDKEEVLTVRVPAPEKESSTKFESHSNWTMSSYWNRESKVSSN